MSCDVTINATRKNTSATVNPDRQNHSRMHKVAFTPDDDALLMKYIATYNPQLKGRLGMKLYERLVENAERKWSFASRHSVQSWREHYKNNQQRFDAKILRYQEKHGISANTFDQSSSQSTVQSGARKTLLVSSRSRTNISSGSTTPVGENGTKKRRREVGVEDSNLDPGVGKKMRRETASVQNGQPWDSPPHIRAPFAELQNGEKAAAESSSLMLAEEDDATLVIGSDDYTGALPGSGDSDQEVGGQSEDRGASAPAMVSRPSTPVNNAEVDPFLASRKSASPYLVGATAAHEEPSHPHQKHDIPPGAAVSEASEFVRDSVGAPPQLSQEPTPPHTSAINSPRSPLQCQPSPTNDTLLQPEIGSHRISSVSQKQKRLPPSRRKRTIVSGDEDDIFSTPPPQAVRESPPPRTSRREAPHLVEGPFRNAYTNSNGQYRSMLHDRSPSGTDEEAGADGADKEWPPRRGGGRSPIPTEGLNSTRLRECVQSIANAQPQRPPSSTLYAPNAISIDTAVSVIEHVITHKNLQGSTSQMSQTKAVPLQAARTETPAVGETSKGVCRPPQPSLSRDKLQPNFKRRSSTHGSIQAKGPAPVTSHNRLLFPAAPVHELPPPIPGPPSKRASLDQNPNSAALDDPSVNDPFKVPLVNREARRWTLAGNSEIPRVDARREDLIRRASVHHIDLRALHLGKSVRTSLVGRAISVGRSNTSESSSGTTKKWSRRPSRSSTPPNLSESNRELVFALGLEAVYSRMAKNHKFHIDVVREVAARQRSLEDADRVLCNMREAAGREFTRLLADEVASVGRETGESEEEDEDDDNSGDEENDSQSVQPPHALSLNYLPQSPVPQGRARRLALKIPTASPDPSPTRPPDYSPPTPTRARAFRRLERQGRVEEAKLREACLVRRNLRSSSAEADEQRITTYLLQLREDDKDGVQVQEPGRTSNITIDPVCDPAGDAHNDALPSPLGHDLDNNRGGDAYNVTTTMVDTKPSQKSELEDEDTDTTEVEEQVDVNCDCQTLLGLQAIGPEAETHMDSTGVEDAVIAAERQSPLGNVSTEEIRHNGFFLDTEYAAKATSSLTRSALATLSVLDAEWTNSDDELLLDGGLTVHEELVRRKGLCSVKFRIAHLYSLLLDG